MCKGSTIAGPVTRRGFLALSLAAVANPGDLLATPKLMVGRQQTRMQPSGSLSHRQTWRLAEQMIAMHLRHEARLSAYDVFLVRVAETGSMRPALGDGDVVIMEIAPYEVLGVGDIVWWVDDQHTCWGLDGQRGPQSVLHRITGGRPGLWITRGDNNVDADPGRMTPSRYRARVCQVLHSQKRSV